MATLEIRLRNTGTYNFVAGATTTDVRLIGGGGNGGTGGTVGAGGGGGGGAFAQTPNVATLVGTTYDVRVGTGTQSTTFATTTVVALAGGNGGNGSTSAGAAGAAGSGPSSTGTTKVSGSPGIAGGSGGAGANSGTLPTGASGGSVGTTTVPATGGNAPAGGGGGGSPTISGPGGPGARGEAVIVYSTGSPTISHTAIFSRRAVVTFRAVAIIISTAVFSRRVALNRAFSSTTFHSASLRKAIQVLKLASITHTAVLLRRDLGLNKIALITHIPAIRKAITTTKLATTSLVALFARSVGVSRFFRATTTHVARAFATLPLGALTAGSGGTTIIKKAITYIFDD